MVSISKDNTKRRSFLQRFSTLPSIINSIETFPAALIKISPRYSTDITMVFTSLISEKSKQP